MKIFTKDCCDSLLKYVGDKDQRINYVGEVFDSTDFKYLNIETKYELPENIALEPTADKDYENSVKIFEALKNLDRVQANDKRLWVTLTHTCFFEYTQKRWNISNSDSDNTLIRRFHFEGSSLEARMRNSISRLWWAAKLTFDKSRTDNFELTKLLWSRQDIYQNIVERSYGTYDSVVKGFLEFYSANPQLKEDQLRRLFTALNSVGGVKLLSAHTENEIKSTLKELATYYKITIAA